MSNKSDNGLTLAKFWGCSAHPCSHKVFHVFNSSIDSLKNRKDHPLLHEQQEIRINIVEFWDTTFILTWTYLSRHYWHRYILFEYCVYKWIGAVVVTSIANPPGQRAMAERIERSAVTFCYPAASWWFIWLKFEGFRERKPWFTWHQNGGFKHNFYDFH